MLKKLIALGAFAAATVVVPATAAQAAAAPTCGTPGYAACVPTRTDITAKATAPGVAVQLTVNASANDPRIPEGDIAVQVTGNAKAARTVQAKMSTVLFSTTVHFTGTPIKIEGPALPKGTYGATAALTPDDLSYFLPSKGSTRFGVGVGGGVTGDDGDNGGALPDTGGPNLMWLLLGSGLVVSGAGSVVYARRREPATA